MKKYILEGQEAEVKKVLRENRVRVAMGLIKFRPVADGTGFEPETDKKEVEATDTKETEVTDKKEVEVADKKDAPETDKKKVSKKSSRSKK